MTSNYLSLDKMILNIFNFQQGTGLESVLGEVVCVCARGWGGAGGGRMKSSWEVLVLSVIFIKPG